MSSLAGSVIGEVGGWHVGIVMVRALGPGTLVPPFCAATLERTRVRLSTRKS
jgi:hypothetical protein